MQGTRRQMQTTVDAAYEIALRRCGVEFREPPGRASAARPGPAGSPSSSAGTSGRTEARRRPRMPSSPYGRSALKCRTPSRRLRRRPSRRWMRSLRVLADVGATRPARDAADAALVKGVRFGTGRLVASPSAAAGWPTLAAGKPPVDTDHDGMPDVWETAHGLNPKNPRDGAAYAGKTGYTNLEIYLDSVG